MNGRVFDIQRFSIYDGPGIRTNVFFKGCNLRCIWCHNPESQRKENDLMMYPDKCVHCGACAGLCDKAFTSDCTGCGKCAEVCSYGARVLSGRDVSSDEVLDTILRDKKFYHTSGGGVTLTGGEPLLQPEFASELMKKCKSSDIHTAIETAGNVPWTVFDTVLPYTDYILYDIKAYDDKSHRELTGVTNSLILDNAKKLMKSGVSVRFRTPVIPGYNDREVAYIAEFVKGFEYELIAYHETGCGKYASLGRKYRLSDVIPPTSEWMRTLSDKVEAIYDPTGI